ncbi:MAG: tRNA (N6-isopentenyl adenosine(37)-C2)-methylthiotransferase MiaB [Lentisphaeria bacterium]|nr:tRNA (N6-isopentenyl adenosine(37)-C2)-methylthiotransferase MiaB [Lentisphaeria bacterium]
MKVYIKTYGCQMNERDSDAMAALLREKGHEIVSAEEEADALIFNTCSVREAAERKAKGKIGYMKKLKARKPELIIGVAGCMAQRLGDALLEELPHLDFVLGTGQLHTLLEQLEKVRAKHLRFAETEPSPDVLTGMSGHYSGTWHGEIAITRGCNRFCSYCIVPYVRGREISRSQEDVLAEARRLVDSGARELLLLGQNVAAYGLGGDIRPPADDHSPFADLLDELDRLPGLLRIRYTSPYVSYFNRRLIRTLAQAEKVCHNIHLPLQSGSDRILAAMNRQYTRDSYLAKAAELRAAIPDLTFSTDVIVGFPGETDEDFRLTREVMNEMDYAQSFIFKYSPRPGAKSAQMADSVPEEVKEERNQILLADLAARVRKRLAAMNGETVEVLVEGISPRTPARWTGRTGTNLMIHFEPDAAVRPGTLRKVKITQTNPVSLFGKLVD